MKQVHGWWVPDYDTDLEKAIDKEKQFAGRTTYQLHTFTFALQYVKNFRFAIDGGAHVGFWSWYMSRCFSHVEAFEPISTHSECHIVNISERNVHLNRVGLGDKNESRVFATKPPWSLKGRVHTNEPEANTVKAQLVKLDDFDDFIDVDFIKLDLEGFEYFAIQGGEQLIKRCKPVMVVEQKAGNARYGLSAVAGIDLLRSWGGEVVSKAHDDYVVIWP